MHPQRPGPDPVIHAHHDVWDPATRDHSWLTDPGGGGQDLRPDVRTRQSSIDNGGRAALCEIALDAFGPDRLMFGSDWPVCLPAAGYAQGVAAARELTAERSEAERAAVFAGAARRAYRLDVQ
jgi:Amidohydrolase